MNKSKIVYVCSIILSLCVVTACEKLESSPPLEVSLLPETHYGNSLNRQGNRELLFSFVMNQLSGSNGVYTNYQDTDQAANVATGHEVLSESAGLFMRYYALTGQQEAFEAEWERAKNTFNLKTGFSYRYSPEHKKLHRLNAAVDDLRIIRALHEAGLMFNESRYITEADHYGDRFYKYNIKDDRLYDFYDETYQITNDFITLCYIDLKTIQLLPLTSKQEQPLVENMQEIIRNGYLSDNFPFYETRYEYKTNSYSSEHINTVESLLTILALSEIEQQNPLSIAYLKEQVQAGTLYGQYTKDGVPNNQIQSTAIYAIAAMIGAELEDKALYDESIRRMSQFQVADKSSLLAGGFGDTASGQAYSFDNLLALLAYSY